MRISDWSSDVCSSDLPRSSRRGSLRLSRSEGRRLSSSSAVSRSFPTHGPLAHTKPITPSSEANSEGRAAGGVGGVRMDGALASHAAGHDGGLPFAAPRARCDTTYAGWGWSEVPSYDRPSLGEG